MSGGWPLLRRASGRMLRSGALAVMLTISIALLAGLVTAGPLFGRATATGSLERKLDTVLSNSQLIQQAALGVVIQGQASPGTQDQVAAMVDAAPWLGAPVTTQFAAAWQLQYDKPTPFLAVGDQRRSGVLWSRTGAIEALDVVSGTRGAKGIWLPERTAKDLGLKPGEEFRVGRTIQGSDIVGCTRVGTVADDPGEPANRQTRVRLAGTYRTRPDGQTPLGPYFTAIAAQLPSDPLGCPSPAVLMISDQSTIAAALGKIQESPIWTHSRFLTPAGRTPEHLKQASDTAEKLKLAGADPGSRLAQLLAADDTVGRVETALPELQSGAEADARTAAQQGRGIGYAGGALGLAAVVLALRALAQRRRQETELLIGLGTPMPMVVGAGVLELLLPAVLGSAIGAAGAWLAFSWFGPQSDLGPGTVRATVLAAVLVAALALLCNALVILLQARSIGRELDGTATPGARGPWLPLLTGATVLAVGATFARDNHGSYTDPMSAVLPILVLACGSLLVVRIIALAASVLTHGRRTRPPEQTPVRSPDRLVVRGLRNTGTAVADLVVILAIGVGVLAYGLVSATAVHASVTDKTAVMAGATSVAHISRASDLGGGEGPTPKLGPGQTLIWRATGQLRPDYLDVDVLAINPDLFRSTADWGTGPGLAQAKAALNVFAAAPGSDVNSTVRAVLVGLPDRAIGSGATISVGADQLALTVRSNLTTFPGATRPTVVLDARSLFTSPDAHNSDDQVDYATWLWSTDSPTALRSYLDQHDVVPLVVTSLQAARSTPVFTSSGWAATYQVVLGGVAAMLAGLSLIVAVDRRVARAAPVDLVLRRFGVHPTRLLGLRALELALTCLGALAVLALPFALVLLLLPRLVEPGPDLAPAMTVQVPLMPLLLSAAAAAAITLLAVLVAARRSATLKPAEVLRDDQ